MTQHKQLERVEATLNQAVLDYFVRQYRDGDENQQSD